MVSREPIYIHLQMSLTFQQIILDAKKLVIRISDHENTADTLISEVEAVCGQIDNMKQVNIVTYYNNSILYITYILFSMLYSIYNMAFYVCSIKRK